MFPIYFTCLQQAQLQANSNPSTSNNHSSILQRNSTNLAISALANSLMDSAQQFTQQQAAGKNFSLSF